MGYVVEVSTPENARILVDLSKLEFFFDEAKEVAVIKKKPIMVIWEGCGARHWYKMILPRIQGGFKLYRVADNKYERMLPLGKVTAEKDEESGEWKVTAEGYHIFISKDEKTLRPVRSTEDPARIDDVYVILVYHASLASRSCTTHIKIDPIKGDVHYKIADTACRIDSNASAVVFAKNGSAFRICRGDGDYRGSCWENCEVVSVSIRLENGQLVINASRDEKLEAELGLTEEDIA